MADQHKSYAHQRKAEILTREVGLSNSRAAVVLTKHRDKLESQTTAFEPDYSYRYLLSPETRARLEAMEGK